jgi:hypothetical protein
MPDAKWQQGQINIFRVLRRSFNTANSLFWFILPLNRFGFLMCRWFEFECFCLRVQAALVRPGRL